VVQIDPAEFGAAPEEVRKALEERDIESRPVWKPLHLQPLFRSCRVVGGAVSERLFRDGLCLPSGSQMTEGDILRVVETLRSLRQGRLHRVRTRRLAS
jgi:dTDP-4-amino-4,6-dideoxygalactose transaminase